MTIKAAAWCHALVVSAAARARSSEGQGTVEYVGTVVMVTLLVAGVAAAARGWAPDVGQELRRGLLRAVKRLTGEFSA